VSFQKLAVTWRGEGEGWIERDRAIGVETLSRFTALEKVKGGYFTLLVEESLDFAGWEGVECLEEVCDGFPETL